MTSTALAVGDRVNFEVSPGETLPGEVVRVWTNGSPYVTVRTLEDRPRRFVRLADRVQLDPVAACLAVHAAAQVAHCAGCGICEDCDATLGVQETPDHELCETCANTAEQQRGRQLLATAYTTDRSA